MGIIQPLPVLWTLNLTLNLFFMVSIQPHLVLWISKHTLNLDFMNIQPRFKLDFMDFMQPFLIL